MKSETQKRHNDPQSIGTKPSNFCGVIVSAFRESILANANITNPRIFADFNLNLKGNNKMTTSNKTEKKNAKTNDKVNSTLEAAQEIVGLITSEHSNGVTLTKRLRPLVLGSYKNKTNIINPSDDTLLKAFQLCAESNVENVRKRQKERFSKAVKAVCVDENLNKIMRFKVIPKTDGKTFTLTWAEKPAKNEKTAARTAFDNAVKAFIKSPNQKAKDVMNVKAIALAKEHADLLALEAKKAEAMANAFILA